jgi:ABC-type sugar transport system permease subunit
MSTAFQPDRELMATPPHLWPSPATLEHFYNVFVVKEFHRYILNSVIVAGTTTLICLIFGLLGAYALARFDVRGRFGVLGLILSISMFPQIAIVAPLYLIMSNIDLLDTYTGLIVVYLALGLPQACPPGATFTEPPEPMISRRGAWHLACCATPYLPRPAATIGLGDSFLAGTLLILSQPTSQPSTIPSRVKETAI